MQRKFLFVLGNLGIGFRVGLGVRLRLELWCVSKFAVWTEVSNHVLSNTNLIRDWIVLSRAFGTQPTALIVSHTA
jgi:hypothetical protein